MKDSIILGTGNSRYLKSVENFKALYPTYDDFVAALVAGTLPVDFNGINSAGFQQVGDALGKDALLKDSTAALYGLEDNAVPDDVLAKLSTLIPIGTIFWYAKNSVPAGFLACDGSLVGRENYAELFSAIGTTFGAGDGSTTFALPDLRAKFIRGAGSSGGYSASFGKTNEATGLASGISTSNDKFAIINVDKNSGSTSTATASRGGPSNVTYNHFRPYNIALQPIIKYRGGTL